MDFMSTATTGMYAPGVELGLPVMWRLIYSRDDFHGGEDGGLGQQTVAFSG